VTKRLERRIKWLILGMIPCVLGAVGIMSGTVHGEIGIEEILSLLREHQGGSVPSSNGIGSTLLYGFASVVMGSLVATVIALWKQNRKLLTLIREADQQTLQGAQDSALVREKILERVDSIDRANAEWRSKGIAAVIEIATAMKTMAGEMREMTREMMVLKKNCAAVTRIGVDLPGRPTDAGRPGGA